MQHQGAFTLTFSRASWWATQPTDVLAGVFVEFGDKFSATAAALGHVEHVGIDKLDQPPGAGEGQ